MMLLPLPQGATAADAKALARRLGRLTLGELLSHKAGVSVREVFAREGAGWKRVYRVRFQFESPARIRATFGVDFPAVVACVEGAVFKRMSALVTREARRTGSVDAAKEFKSSGGGREGEAAGAGGDVEGEDGEHAGGGRKKSSRAVGALLDGDGDEEEEGNAEGEGEGGRVRASEGEEYGDSDDDDGADLSGPGGPLGAVSEGEGDEADSGGEEGVSPAAKGPAGPAQDAEHTKRWKKGLGESTGTRHSAAEGWVELRLSLPAAARRLLLVQVAEEAAAQVAVYSTKGIAAAYAVTESGGDRPAVQTEGVNFEAAWELGAAVECAHIASNDIYALLQTYGVEAARRSIVGEVVGVFGVYGINVNLRHLSLIADFMTRGGGYVPMSRRGMGDCASPFLQMSFETTCTFLTKAAQEGLVDEMESPSARIVLGKVPRLGTGAFELLVPLQDNQHHA